jgi:nucleoside-diphosphate-sugar epimerase
MKVLIAGAGDLGQRVAKLLRDAEIEVTAFTRSGGAGLVQADLFDSQAMRALAAEHNVGIFCAAPKARDEASYRKLYLDGLQAILACDRVVFCASTAVYDVDDGSLCDETRSINPQSLAFNGRVLLEAESLLRTQDLSLRLGGIYGPGRDFALRQVRAGAVAQSGLWTNRIHIIDAAHALVHLLLGDAQGVFNVVDPNPCTQAEQYAFLRQLYGLEEVSAIASMPSGKRVSNAKLASTGFRYRFPSYREGYAALKI